MMDFEQKKTSVSLPSRRLPENVPQDKRDQVEAAEDGLLALNILKHKGTLHITGAINNAEGLLTATLIEAGVPPKDTTALIVAFNASLDQTRSRHVPGKTAATLGG
jgi:hypothetical protein